jgi:hypothetical protein
METIEGADQSIQLTSIGYPINMSDIYFRTEHL